MYTALDFKHCSPSVLYIYVLHICHEQLRPSARFGIRDLILTKFTLNFWEGQGCSALVPHLYHNTTIKEPLRNSILFFLWPKEVLYIQFHIRIFFQV